MAFIHVLNMETGGNNVENSTSSPSIAESNVGRNRFTNLDMLNLPSTFVQNVTKFKDMFRKMSQIIHNEISDIKAINC